MSTATPTPDPTHTTTATVSQDKTPLWSQPVPPTAVVPTSTDNTVAAKQANAAQVAEAQAQLRRQRLQGDP